MQESLVIGVMPAMLNAQAEDELAYKRAFNYTRHAMH